MIFLNTSLVTAILLTRIATSANAIVFTPFHSSSFGHKIKHQSIIRLRGQLAAACATAVGVLTFVGCPVAHATEENLIWKFNNGDVEMTDPMPFAVRHEQGRDEEVQLTRPRLLGSGGGGAVFAFTPKGNSNNGGTDFIREDVALKLSWVRSAASVEKECSILQVLEENKVQGVERCLGKKKYPMDTQRVMILMKPVIEDSVASVTEINPELQSHSVRCIVQTMVQMLAANVVTTDVQPLISRATGDVIFIDMTEAKVMSPQQRHQPLPFLDLALASSFCVEMLSLVPESFYSVASGVFLQELKSVESRGMYFPDEIYDVLRSQTQIMSQESLDYIDARIGSLEKK